MPTHRNDSGNGEKIKAPSLWSWFQLIVLILIAIGFFNIYSSTFYMNLENGINPYRHVIFHVGYCILGGLICYIVYLLPLSLWKRSASIIAVITFFALLSVFLFGRTVNGATRWIYIAGISIQPSEIAKVAAVLWAASRLARRMEKKKLLSLFALFRWIGKRFSGRMDGIAKESFVSIMGAYIPLMVPFLFAVMIMEQPDMGTAALVLGFPVLLYIFCGSSLREVLGMIVVAVIGFFGLAFLEPYRWERIRVLWDPFPHASDEGYQTVQSLIAVGSGGFWGQGAGEGLSKFLYLPEQHTDFAYAVLSQEGGFLIAGAVLLLYGALLVVGFLMARRISDPFPALLVYGLTMLIGVEGLLNIAMVIGSFPVTGVPLPFISFGGSSLVMNLFGIGLIGNAVRYGERIRLREERQRKLDTLGVYPESLQQISGAVFRPSSDERLKRY